MEQAAEANPFPPVPPDEPLNQMNLHWPRCVRYRHAHDPSRPEPARTNAPLDAVCEVRNYGLGTESRRSSPEPRNSRQEESQVSDTSPTYHPALNPNEFRILWLPAGKKPTDTGPIHCELETFALDDCPEYEAISYAWGGEDGDSTRTQPVFVGPYWDVLLQTRNCFDMLKHMRPYKGMRAIWVDSLCINQDDEIERAQQVANMPRLYQECSRAVVFLGQKSIQTTNRLTPRRGDLRQFFSTNTSEVRHLLQMRYFSRMWIIQELILPRELLIRVRDTDYHLCKTTSSEEFQVSQEDWSWDTAPAAWFRYVTRRALPSRDIVNILNMTASSNAGDIRDKIFAFLGLLESNSNTDMQTMAPQLYADYSLSCQQLFTGLFAYLITYLRMPWILRNAAGIAGWSQYPSWVPPWRDRNIHELLGYRTGVELEHLLEEIRNTADDPGTIPDEVSRRFKMLRWVSPLQSPSYSKLSHEEAQYVDSFYLTPSQNEFYGDGKHLVVDPEDGALSLTLMLLFHFNKTPSVALQGNGWTLFSISGDRTSFYIVTAHHTPLHELVDPTRDVLFLFLVDRHTYIPLILRPDAQNADGLRWRIVSVCEAIGTGDNVPHLMQSSFATKLWIDDLLSPLSYTLRAKAEEWFPYVRGKYHHIWDCGMKVLARIVRPPGETDISTRCPLDNQGVIRLFAALLDEDDRITARDSGTFSAELCKLAARSLEPRVEGDYFIIKLEQLSEDNADKDEAGWPDLGAIAWSQQIWDQYFVPSRSFATHNKNRPHWQVWHKDDERWEVLPNVAYEPGSSYSQQEAAVQVFTVRGGVLVLGVELEELKEWMRSKSGTYEAFRTLKALHKGGVIDFFERGPSPESCTTSHSRWPEELMTEFDIVGKAMQVHIV